jgi:hypothetical protein
VSAFELLEATYPYRVSLGVAFFLTLGVRDWRKHPEDPKRAKEYLFLLYAMLCAIAYGVVHDQITSTISPEYFLAGKGLADDPRPFRWAVTVLAIHASYGVGLVAGALLLIANNPSPSRPQLAYRELAPLALLPLAFAAALAVAGGVADLGDPFHLERKLKGVVAPPRTARFLFVWGVHAGSYAGAVIGLAWAVWLVRAGRREPDPPIA